MDKEHEIISEQKLAALRKSLDDGDTDQNNVNSKKISKRVLLKSLLPVLIAGGCVVSAQSPLKPSIPEILPQVYASSSSPSVPADYIIFNSDGTYYALNCATGNLDYESSTADVVINNANTAMPNGGVVYLTSNTNFNLASPLVYNFGFQPTGAFAEWVLEGAGASSLITQNTSSTDAIQLSNRTRVHFRGFNMSIGGSAGIAINGLGTGTSEISTEGSRFEDIGIYANAGSPSNYTSVVSLVNIANSQFDEIGLTGVPASGGNLMQLINDSTSVDYGNSLFNDIELNLPSNFPTNSNGLYISGTAGNTTNFGICTFNNCFAFYEGTTYTGIVTLLLNAGCSALTFINGDFENGDIAVKVTAAASAPTANINFFGGYFSGRTAVFSSSDGNCGPINFFGSTFANVGGGTTLINDGGSGGSSDLFSDVQTNGNGTITFGAALPPLFRGSAGSGAHWSNQGTSIQNGTGAKVTFYITHNLVTLTSGKPRYSMVVVNGNLGPYTWAISGKQISVTFVTAPPTGTGNVIMNWSAGI